MIVAPTQLQVDVNQHVVMPIIEELTQHYAPWPSLFEIRPLGSEDIAWSFWFYHPHNQMPIKVEVKDLYNAALIFNQRDIVGFIADATINAIEILDMQVAELRA